MGTFKWNGLTLQVGADLAEINQMGRDILSGMVAAIPTVLIVTLLGARWVAQQGSP